MTVQVAIARTRARITGDHAEAAAVQRKLDALLAVALRAGLQGGPASGQWAPDDPASAAVFCLPDLHLRLRLSRAALDSPDAAKLWAAAIRAACDAALAGAGSGAPGAQAWRFADRRDYHAAYLRFRLGLSDTPARVFAGFEALDLLSPLRALEEMAAADPLLWSRLAPGGLAEAKALLRAITAQAGAAGAQMVWAQVVHSAEAAAARAGRAAALRGALRWLDDAAHLPALPAPGLLAGQPPACRALLVLLAVAPLADSAAVWIARVQAVLGALDPVPEPGGADLPRLVAALRRVAVEQPVAGALGPALAALARAGAQDGALILRVAAALAVRGRARPAAAPVSPAGPGQDAAAPFGSAARAPQPAPRAALRHFASEQAGIGLLLPHLAEDGIGMAFPSALLHDACAALLRDSPGPDPQDALQDDPFLRALTGTRLQDAPCDRPHDRDMLFVPEARRAAIAAAPPGAARLSAWLLARFCATLPGLAGSSLAFVRRQFLHWPGEVWIDRDRVTLRIDPMPLLPVLQMAGRLGEGGVRLDWLQGQRLTLLCERAAP
ncbi:MAG: hypothetical protein GW886_05755 [Rhodobacterales bacterium]|nr:hypothetical protein [Rhodobacterales bacterium]